MSKRMESKLRELDQLNLRPGVMYLDAFEEFAWSLAQEGYVVAGG